MKAKVRRMAITATLALLVAIGVPVFVHRREFDIAVLRWTQNQNAENAAALATERATNRSLEVDVEVATGVVVFLVLNAGWFIRDQLRRTAGD
jgi:hypothetical protein